MNFGLPLLVVLSAFVAASSLPARKNLPAKQSGAGSNAQKAEATRIRIAEGKYEVYNTENQGGIGRFSPSVYNFTKSWTLRRLPDGTLEVEGERSYDAPQYEPHIDAFSVKLSSQFGVAQITE